MMIRFWFKGDKIHPEIKFEMTQPVRPTFSEIAYVSAYICTFECKYIRLCIYIRTYVYVCLLIRFYVCLHIRFYACFYVCTFV